jgi:hypothetical protein
MFVPEERADSLMSALADAGETGWRIGRTLAADSGSPAVVTVA